MAKSLIVCEYCGKEFLKRNDQINKFPVHFCSRACQGFYRSKENAEKSIGFISGNLTVISFAYLKKQTYVECLCSCGRICVKRLNHIKKKEIVNCGNCRGKTIKERFMSYVKIVSGTEWLWEGAPGSLGYGSFSYNGKSMRAHQVSYILFKGDIPEGMCVLHKDDNPPNICPSNLWLGTQQQNIADCISKDRRVYSSRKGSKSSFSKLKEEEVLEIRSLYLTGNYTQKDLAEIFNSSRSNIGLIINHKTWKEVGES